MTTLLSCKKERPPDVEYRAGSIEKTSKDFLIPREVRSDIEKKYLKFIRSENIKNVLTDEELLSRIPREYLDIEIYLRADAPGVLSNNTKFLLPRGGGEIDLKDYVRGKKGYFYLVTNVKRTNQPSKKIDKFLVYFLSETKSRKILGDKFGSGCRKYMDITKIMLGANSRGGLQLNVTDLRYLPVIGGTFYFVNFDPERKIYLGALRVTDTRYSDFFCESSAL